MYIEEWHIVFYTLKKYTVYPYIDRNANIKKGQYKNLQKDLYHTQNNFLYNTNNYNGFMHLFIMMWMMRKE